MEPDGPQASNQASHIFKESHLKRLCSRNLKDPNSYSRFTGGAQGLLFNNKLASLKGIDSCFI